MVRGQCRTILNGSKNMLEALRNSVNTLTAKILLGLLVISFAVWGVADVFTGRTDTVVAQVGEGEVEAQRFAVALSDQMQNLQRQTGQRVSLSDARELGLDQVVLAQLTTRAALDQEARAFGLSASNDDIRDVISEAPAFQGPGGVFDRLTYERRVRDRGVSVGQFEEDVRADLAREAMLQTIGVGTSAPRALTETLYKFRNERRRMDYILLTPGSAEDPGEPDEAALEAYHKDNASRFTAPEYRRIGVVWLTPESLAETITVSDEKIRQAYDDRRATGEFTTPATRSVEQLLFDNEEAAQAAMARLEGDVNFKDIAKEQDKTASDISLGTVERGDLPEDLSAAIFAASEPGVLAPIQTAFGWTLLNVTTVQEEVISSFEEVGDDIRRDLAEIEARDRILEEMVAVDDELAGGATVEAAGKLTAATYVLLDAVDASGRTPEGRSNAGVPPIPGVLAKAFDTEVGVDPILTEADSGGFYALAVEEITPAALRPLEDIREDVVAAWKREQRINQLEVIAEGYRTRIAEGEALEALAEAEEHRIATAGPMLRSQRAANLTEKLRNDMFRGSEGDVLLGSNNDESGYIIGVVAEIVEEEAEAVEAAIDAETERYAAALSSDMVQTFTRTVQERHPTLLKPRVIDSVLSEIGQRY